MPCQLLSLVSQRYCPPPTSPHSLSTSPPSPFLHCSVGSSSQGSGWGEGNGTPCLRVGSMSPSPLAQSLNKSPLLSASSPVSLRLHVQTKPPHRSSLTPPATCPLLPSVVRSHVVFLREPLTACFALVTCKILSGC